MRRKKQQTQAVYLGKTEVAPISKQGALRANRFRICVWVWQEKKPFENTCTEACGT